MITLLLLVTALVFSILAIYYNSGRLAGIATLLLIITMVVGTNVPKL